MRTGRTWTVCRCLVWGGVSPKKAEIKKFPPKKWGVPPNLPLNHHPPLTSPLTSPSTTPPENIRHPPKFQTPPKNFRHFPENFRHPPWTFQTPPKNFRHAPLPKISDTPPENFRHPPEISDPSPRKFQTPPQDQTRHPPLWTEFLTHACENITLAKTSFRPVMILECITQHIDNIDPPALSCSILLRSVPTQYLLRTLSSDWSRSFWLLSLLLEWGGKSYTKTKQKVFHFVDSLGLCLSGYIIFGDWYSYPSVKLQLAHPDEWSEFERVWIKINLPK